MSDRKDVPVKVLVVAKLSKWIELKFTDNESITSIDVYPLTIIASPHRLTRLCHYDIRHGEKIDVERATQLANTIIAECQMRCDGVGKAEPYEIAVVDERHGGQANPVGHTILRFTPSAS